MCCIDRLKWQPEAEVNLEILNVGYRETDTRPGNGNNKSFPVGYR